jgi:hypothetical protein
MGTLTGASERGSVGLLREGLLACAASGLSGTLRITGLPGGTIHLADGLVTGIETPGAPSPEVILLRSRRVTEARWDSAFAAAATVNGPVSAQLTGRQIVGVGELEALLRIALADAMFVLASGDVEEYRAEPGAADCALPLHPGADGDWLLAEASRRIQIVAGLSFPATQDRGRIAAAPGAARPKSRLGDGQAEIMALANGRRTVRDMAFALGRGVYGTMLQLAQMYHAGLLVTSSEGARDGQQAGGQLPRRGKSLPRRPGPKSQP